MTQCPNSVQVGGTAARAGSLTLPGITGRTPQPLAVKDAVRIRGDHVSPGISAGIRFMPSLDHGAHAPESRVTTSSRLSWVHPGLGTGRLPPRTCWEGVTQDSDTGVRLPNREKDRRSGRKMPTTSSCSPMSPWSDAGCGSLPGGPPPTRPSVAPRPSVLSAVRRPPRTPIIPQPPFLAFFSVHCRVVISRAPYCPFRPPSLSPCGGRRAHSLGRPAQRLAAAVSSNPAITKSCKLGFLNVA